MTLGRTGRLVALLAALAGLFAMHGLGDHGSMAADAPMTMAAPGHDDAPALGAPGHGSTMAGIGAGCVALLALGLLLLGVRRALRTTPALPARADAVLRAVVRAPRAPPDRVALCVWRC